MAYSTTAAPTWTDQVGFVPRNILTAAAAKWHTASDGSDDVTDNDFPCAFGVDGYPHKVTKPSGAAATTWYLRFLDPLIDDVDVVAIVNHNFGDPSGGCNVRFETASDDAFTTPVTIHSFGVVPTTTRLIALPTTTFTGLERVRIRLVSTNPFVPQLGEVIMGSLYQVGWPKRPFDKLSMTSDVTRQTSKGGVTTTHRRFARRARKRLSIRTQDSDLIANAREVYRLTDGGAKASLFLQYPSTRPTYGYMVTSPTELDLPNSVGPAEQSWTWELDEVAPPWLDEEYIADPVG